MKIDIAYDSSVTAANFSGGATEEAAFKSAINYVVDQYESLFTNPVTIRLQVGWGEVDGKSLGGGGDIGSNYSNPDQMFDYSYAQVKTALLNLATASGDPAQMAA